MNKTKLIALALAALIAASSLVGCGTKDKTPSSSNVENSSSSEISSSEESKEMPKEEISAISVDYTDKFSIEVMENGVKKVIDGENRELYLVPREMEIPADLADKTVIRTPVEKAIFMSTTFVCALRPLDDPELWDRVAGVGGDADSWGSIPAVQNRMKEGKIKDVGGVIADPDYELITSLEPDIVFVYTGDYPQTGVIENLERLGINYAVNNDYMEKNYLGRAEWEKFVLTFFDKDKEAEEVMNKLVSTVEEVKTKIEGIEKPKVIFASEYNGSISIANTDSWLGTMMLDAGADYLFADLAANGLSISMEDFIKKADEADILIYTSTPDFMPSKEAMFAAMPQLKDCKVAKDDKIWQYTNAFWMGIDQSDIMIEDMASIFYPEQFPNRELTFFQKVAD